MNVRGLARCFGQPAGHPACLNIVDFKDPIHARLTLFNDISHYEDMPERPGAQLSKWWDQPGPQAAEVSSRPS